MGVNGLRDTHQTTFSQLKTHKRSNGTQWHTRSIKLFLQHPCAAHRGPGLDLRRKWPDLVPFQLRRFSSFTRCKLYPEARPALPAHPVVVTALLRGGGCCRCATNDDPSAINALRQRLPGSYTRRQPQTGKTLFPPNSVSPVFVDLNRQFRPFLPSLTSRGPNHGPSARRTYTTRTQPVSHAPDETRAPRSRRVENSPHVLLITMHGTATIYKHSSSGEYVRCDSRRPQLCAVKGFVCRTTDNQRSIGCTNCWNGWVCSVFVPSGMSLAALLCEPGERPIREGCKHDTTTQLGRIRHREKEGLTDNKASPGVQHATLSFAPIVLARSERQGRQAAKSEKQCKNIRKKTPAAHSQVGSMYVFELKWYREH